MGLTLITLILLSLSCVAIMGVMVAIAIWSHNTQINQDGWIDKPKPPQAETSDQANDEMRDLSQSGNNIVAIQRYRQNTGAGFRDAKDADEAPDSDKKG